VTFPTDQPAPDYSLSDVLHLLVDHGRLPDEVTSLACHRAVDVFFTEAPPAADDTVPVDTVSTDSATATTPTFA
jgi:hypothetical protein